MFLINLCLKIAIVKFIEEIDGLVAVQFSRDQIPYQEFGRRTTDFAGFWDEASGIALQADDKIVVVTRSFNGSNSTVLGLARYLSYSVADFAATVATSSKNVVVGGQRAASQWRT